jgi:hypothetical protein
VKRNLRKLGFLSDTSTVKLKDKINRKRTQMNTSKNGKVKE